MIDATFSTQVAYKKVIISGNILEVYEMENAPYQFGAKNDEAVESDLEWINELANELDDKRAMLDPEYQHMLAVFDGRLKKNITRTRNMVRRLILSNFTNGSKFITFTFRENITDVQEANKHWHTFIKRLRRKYDGFSYISVIEFQKRGAVHYHMLSDLPYVKAAEMEELWGNGFIKINRITHVDNVGAYVIKYMTKDLTDIRLFNNKAYNCSQGLVRPMEFRGASAERMLEKYGMLDENGILHKKEVFTNSYVSEHLGKITYREYNLDRL